MKFIILLSLTLANTGFSQSKKQVSQLIDQLKSSGQFSPEQLEKAKQQLNKMDDETFNSFIQTAKEKSKDPKVRAEAMKVLGQKPTNN